MLEESPVSDCHTLFEPDLGRASVGKLFPFRLSDPCSAFYGYDMATQLLFSDLWDDVLAVCERSSLVHSITNLVVANFKANVLLAAGASPVMAHAHEEVADMVGIAQALVLNTGTLDPYWIESMWLALLDELPLLTADTFTQRLVRCARPL